MNQSFGAILVVEPERAAATLLTGFLTSYGYSVTACFSAREGRDIIDSQNVDALILSARLPDGDGFEFCRQLHRQSAIAILMLTDEGREVDRIIGLESGADDCLAKPVVLLELLARLRAVTRRRRPAAAALERSFEFGRLKIDAGRRTIRMGDVEKSLSSYLFALLVVFAENAGRVLSREELRSILKSRSFASYDRSIDVQVCRLRSLIEDNPRSPQRLVTVRGTGYLFERDAPNP